MKPINEVDFAYSLFVDQYNKYGNEEIQAAIEVLKSGRLFFPIGTHVKKLEERLRAEYNALGCTLVTSGTAAVHVGLGAVGVDFGDEVIVTPIGDTGTVMPILLQGAIPIFADVDPKTLMITAKTIAPHISKRTKALVVVHYGGFPAEIEPIVDLAHKHNIRIVEDCAQATATVHNGKRVGTFGDVGCFSTNDTKHVSCGDGGYVISNTPYSAKRARLYHDKGFDRASKIRNPKIVAPNYRMTEIQAAILNKQWDKLQERIVKRTEYSKLLDNILKNISWVHSFTVGQNDVPSYFSYFFFIDSTAPVSRDEICRALCQAGIPARRGNLYDVQYKLGFLRSGLPRYMRFVQHPEYQDGICPNAERANASMVRLEMLEIFGQEEARVFSKVMNSFVSH